MRHLLLVLPLLLCAYAQAETVYLKDGQSVVGGVVWRGRSGIEMQVAPGCIGGGQKVFIEANRIESVGECLTCDGAEWGINEVPESRLEFEKRMKIRGRVFYKDRWVGVEERDADEARIKAEKEKAAAKESTTVTPLTPATPRSTTPNTAPAPRSTAPAPVPGPAGNANNGAAPGK
jgi:hypothetical protein